MHAHAATRWNGENGTVTVQLPDHAARDGRRDPCFVAPDNAVKGVLGHVGGSIGRHAPIRVHGLGHFAKNTKRARNLGRLARSHTWQRRDINGWAMGTPLCAFHTNSLKSNPRSGSSFHEAYDTSS